MKLHFAPDHNFSDGWAWGGRMGRYGPKKWDYSQLNWGDDEYVVDFVRRAIETNDLPTYEPQS